LALKVTELLNSKNKNSTIAVIAIVGFLVAKSFIRCLLIFIP
jgi:hypothetical protein